MRAKQDRERQKAIYRKLDILVSYGSENTITEEVDWIVKYKWIDSYGSNAGTSALSRARTPAIDSEESEDPSNDGDYQEED